MHVFIKPKSFKEFGRRWRREHETWLQAHLSLGLVGWPRAGTAIAREFSLIPLSERLATSDSNAAK
jgi:hypothetical protein